MVRLASVLGRTNSYAYNFVPFRTALNSENFIGRLSVLSNTFLKSVSEREKYAQIFHKMYLNLPYGFWNVFFVKFVFIDVVYTMYLHDDLI